MNFLSLEHIAKILIFAYISYEQHENRKMIVCYAQA